MVYYRLKNKIHQTQSYIGTGVGCLQWIKFGIIKSLGWKVSTSTFNDECGAHLHLWAKSEAKQYLHLTKSTIALNKSGPGLSIFWTALYRINFQ